MIDEEAFGSGIWGSDRLLWDVCMSTMLLSLEPQQLHVLQSPRSLLLPYHGVPEHLARRVMFFSNTWSTQTRQLDIIQRFHGEGHGTPGTDQVILWLLGHKRPQQPRVVHLSDTILIWSQSGK